MAATPRMELLFGTRRVEVDASLAERRGGLRILAREAEQQLGLRAHTYGFYDSFGKVDTPAALQRVFDSARDVCQLEIRESVEGKMMREMHTAMKSFEDKLLAKMEEQVASVRLDLESRVNRVAAEQVSLRARVDEMLDEALAVRTDTLAMEEEVKERIDSLAQDCLAMRVDTLAGEQELIERLDALVMEGVRDSGREQLAQNHEEMQADIRSLEQTRVVVQEVHDDKNCETQQEAIEERIKPADMDSAKAFGSAWTMPKIVKCPFSNGVPYSFKAPPLGSFKQDQRWGGGFEAFAPFAHAPSRFHNEGLRGLRPSRSTPLLAPLM